LAWRKYDGPDVDSVVDIPIRAVLSRTLAEIVDQVLGTAPQPVKRVPLLIHNPSLIWRQDRPVAIEGVHGVLRRIDDEDLGSGTVIEKDETAIGQWANLVDPIHDALHPRAGQGY
jgi:hypothetical protein